MKDMAEQNRRLKRMYAEMGMQNDLLKEALGKSVKAVPSARNGNERSHAAGHQYRAGLSYLPNQSDLLSLQLSTERPEQGNHRLVVTVDREQAYMWLWFVFLISAQPTGRRLGYGWNRKCVYRIYLGTGAKTCGSSQRRACLYK